MSRDHVSVQIEGWEELEATLKKLGEHINTEKVMTEALMRGAETVKTAIVGAAPYRTGQLRDSIAISKQGRKKFSVRIGPSGKGFYGRFLEYGTSKMAARPFMRPVFDTVVEGVQKQISEDIWKSVREAAEKK